MQQALIKGSLNIDTIFHGQSQARYRGLASHLFSSSTPRSWQKNKKSPPFLPSQRIYHMENLRISIDLNASILRQMVCRDNGMRYNVPGRKNVSKEEKSKEEKKEHKKRR